MPAACRAVGLGLRLGLTGVISSNALFAAVPPSRGQLITI